MFKAHDEPITQMGILYNVTLLSQRREHRRAIRASLYSALGVPSPRAVPTTSGVPGFTLNALPRALTYVGRAKFLRGETRRVCVTLDSI